MAQDSWDYIVVGGGSSGCVLANRLSANPDVRVLLLDAGGSDQHLFSRIPAAIGMAISRPAMNWQYLSQPDASRGSRRDMWPAGRMLGGGSAINGMMFVRGNRWDYDHWASLGNAGWSFDEVLPCFRRLEHNERGADDYRGTGGPQSVAEVRVDHPMTRAFVEGMQELGVDRSPDLNGASQDGVDYCQVTQRRGLRHSTARAYLAPVKGRSNLEIRTGALVTGLRIEQGAARAVDYRRGDRHHQAAARRGVVLCAGAIASPRLLMLSGIGSPAHLDAMGVAVTCELPGVGQNLQEHPGLILSAHVNGRTLTSDRNPLRAVGHGINFLLRGRGPLTNPVGHAHAFVRTRSGLPAPNIQIIFSPLSYDHHEGGATPYPHPAVNIAVGLCRVHSRGQVLLRSPDPLAPPVIDYALLSHDDDVAQLVEGARLARRLYTTRAFSGYFVNERKPGQQFASDEELETVVREQSFLMYHPCGTCRMGVDDEAVVDPQLRVRGVEKLWVADASVIPTIPAGNINATVIMIGEKASDLIHRANGTK